MQLKIQRSQRMGGLTGRTVVFCLDVRADYGAAETSDITKYNLGKQLVYSSQAARRHADNMNKQLDRVGSDSVREQATGLARGVVSLALAKMNLNISIWSLAQGHHIECKDLPELLSAEETIMEACRSLKKFLAAAATFSGSVTLVDFDDGEKAHISQGGLDFAALSSPGPDIRASDLAGDYSPPDYTVIGEYLRSLGDRALAIYAAQPELVMFGGLAAAGLAVLIAYHYWWA